MLGSSSTWAVFRAIFLVAFFELFLRDLVAMGEPSFMRCGHAANIYSLFGSVKHLTGSKTLNEKHAYQTAMKQTKIRWCCLVVLCVGLSVVNLSAKPIGVQLAI